MHVCVCVYVNRYLVRVVAAYNTTKVTHATADGQLSDSTTLIRSHHVDIDNTHSSLQPMRVYCDKPCLVMRYNKGELAYCGNAIEVRLKVKSNYFIVRPKVDQRAGLLSLPHLGIFAIHTR